MPTKELTCTNRIDGRYCDGHLMRNRRWLPPKGYDPLLREYKCRSCQAVVYLHRGRIMMNDQTRKSHFKNVVKSLL